MTSAVFNETEAFRQGLAIRKQVLGEAHVERSLAAAERDPFMVPMQQLATEYCWGQLWSRPGLDLKTRSLLNLAILSSLHMSEEFRLHVAAALRNGVSKDEISEVLLQVAVYAGVPKGIAGFRAAKEVLDAIEADAAGPANKP